MAVSGSQAQPHMLELREDPFEAPWNEPCLVLTLAWAFVGATGTRLGSGRRDAVEGSRGWWRVLWGVARCPCAVVLSRLSTMCARAAAESTLEVLMSVQLAWVLSCACVIEV